MTSILECAKFHSIEEGQPGLRAGEVHLWSADLRSVPGRMHTAVSPDEWIRAARFHFAIDRERYVATRAAVRTILGSYLDEDPADLCFEAGPKGKPALSRLSTFLRFNLSHSDDLLLLAVTFGREVGVDVEAMRTQVQFEMLAEHYFSPEEQWALRITPAAQRHRKFFELWTRTEARLKALGRGIGD